jgi:hypothetical protein
MIPQYIDVAENPAQFDTIELGRNTKGCQASDAHA